ncbi:hypothetical protein [Deinococcus sp. Leaf326]|uniref:hypothetical protein n=1 Tax=Deinococcus sp. Leaf326 TaxID=1736338 RepID=UPI0006F43695|nr:hypothetical protein [Deinococcus sp. Leaf326]KQR40776.1 hypothetical protein ASF71_00995 [Deinococcus sp. Leaf326]
MTTPAHQAVLDVMLTDPDRIWPSAEIAARLQLVPSVVSGRLRTLALTLDVEKVATGRYRLRLPGAPAPSAPEPLPEPPPLEAPAAPLPAPTPPVHSPLPVQALGRVDQDAVQRLRDRLQTEPAPIPVAAPPAPPPPPSPVSDLEVEQFVLKVRNLTVDRRKGNAPGAETLAGRLHWSLARVRDVGAVAVTRKLVVRDLYGRYRLA